MPLLIIKSNRSKPWKSAGQLMRQVRKRTLDILAAEGDQVLVVYRTQEAKIYYEENRPLSRTRQSKA